MSDLKEDPPQETDKLLLGVSIVSGLLLTGAALVLCLFSGILLLSAGPEDMPYHWIIMCTSPLMLLGLFVSIFLGYRKRAHLVVFVLPIITIVYVALAWIVFT